MYTTVKTLSTTKQMELVGKKEFTAIALIPNDEIFVVYIASLAISHTSKVYLFHKAQIAFLQVNEVLITVSIECSDLVDVFSFKLVAEL